MIFGLTCRIVWRNAKRNVPLLSSLASVMIFATCFPSLLFAQSVLPVSCITQSIHEVTMSSLESGRISAIHFREGDFVDKGQVILEQDKEHQNLEARRRKLIWESKVELNAASDQADMLKTFYESTLSLFESTQSVSREELARAELEYKSALAEHMRLEIAEERERIEYEGALKTLRNRTLASPIQGTITKLYLEEGESCSQLEPLIDIVDTTKCLLVCNVEEGTGRSLKKGQSVDLSIQTGSESVSREGKIVFVSPIVDAASTLMEVKAEFDNLDGAVRPGVSGVMLLKVSD